MSVCGMWSRAPDKGTERTLATMGSKRNEGMLISFDD